MVKKSQKIFSFFLIALIILISVVVMAISSFQAKSPTLTKSVKFVIPKGQSISMISQRLYDEGLIRSQLAFRALAYKDNLQTKIQAGSFELAASMNLKEIASVLTRGTDDLWLTIPEGYRREQIAESLARQDLTDFDEAEFLQLTEGLEGQLFPDTYLVPKSISNQALVNLLKNTFTSKVSSGLASELAASDMTLNEVLTFASLVQRESAKDLEMPLIAGVIQNRLDVGMALGIDATLQYIKGYDAKENTWWPHALSADKELDSLYNTYKYPGLPPAPICNSGLAAIKAVLNPADTDAFYYLHDPQGNIHTAVDLAGHNSNIKRYLQ